MGCILALPLLLIHVLKQSLSFCSYRKYTVLYGNVINASVVITLANTDCNDAINTL
jgi:hypothetical protein